MLGYSQDKLVISMNYYPTDPFPADEADVGMIVLDKRKALKGQWSYQYIAPPPDAGSMFLINQTGFTPNAAVCMFSHAQACTAVDQPLHKLPTHTPPLLPPPQNTQVDANNKRKEAYLVSATNNDPTATLRVTTLHGLSPNVEYRVQAVNTPACEWPVDIPQPPNLLPNVAGDGRVVSAPKLRFTRVKGQKAGGLSGRQLRLYVSRTVSKNDATNGLRVEVLRVHAEGKKGPAPLTLESALDIFSATDVRVVRVERGGRCRWDCRSCVQTFVLLRARTMQYRSSSPTRPSP